MCEEKQGMAFVPDLVLGRCYLEKNIFHRAV